MTHSVADERCEPEDSRIRGFENGTHIDFLKRFNLLHFDKFRGMEIKAKTA